MRALSKKAVFICMSAKHTKTVVQRYCIERSGVAALEFALITPVMLLMIFAMICLGTFLIFTHEVQELSSSAARSSVAGLSEAERDELAHAFIAASLANSAILNPADVTVQTATSGSPPTDYSVTVNYNLKDTPIPFLAQLISLQFNNISTTSTIQFGGY